MPKSFDERLRALEALEAEPSGPPMVELPPLSDDELSTLIDQGLRTRDLSAANGAQHGA